MSVTRSDVPGFDELGDIDTANVVRCARVLLRRPLLHPGSPDGDLLPMMYRQRTVLRELFGTLLGYRLVVQRRWARLYKTGPGTDPTRGAPSLSPRSYAYLALTLATLTGIGRQVLLSRLAGDVRAAAAEAGITVGDDPADRRALAAALRHLVTLGVISETEGTVTPVGNDPSAEALITVDTDLLGQMVSGPLKEAGGPEELVGLADGTAAGSPHVEQAVRRRLVEDPVVHYADLPAEHASWLRDHHGRESRILERYFGLVTETRKEGVAVTDPEDYLTDVVFPGPGTVARVALLALPQLLERHPARTADNRHPVTWQDVRAVCSELVETYPAAFSRQATEDSAALARAVVDLLHRLRVLRPAESGTDPHEQHDWLLSPSAHRWVPHPDSAPAQSAPAPDPAPPPSPGLSLFDELEGNGPG